MGAVGGWWKRRSEQAAEAKIAELRERGAERLRQGNHEACERDRAEAARVGVVAFGAAQPRVLILRAEWATALTECGRLDEAQAEIDEVRRLWSQLDESLRLAPERADERITLALALFRARRFTDAEELCRRLLEGALSEDARRRTWEVLATTLGDQGRHSEAVLAYDEVVATPAGSRRTALLLHLKARSDRAAVLTYLGRYAEADAECRAVIEAADRLPMGEGAMLRLAAQNNLVMGLAEQGRNEEAEELARVASAEASRRGPAFSRFAFLLQLSVSQRLNSRGEYAQALTLAQEALNGVEPLLAGDTGVAAVSLAGSLLGLGRPDEALESARTAHASCRTMLGPTHHRTLVASTLLGRCLAAAGQRAEAEALLASSAQDWERHFGPEHPRTRAAREALAEITGPLG